MKLAVPPYGQTKRAARHKQMKNNWPGKIISFEAWCAYTYYNPGEGPHGGEKFQKLMNYLLVNGSAWNANTIVPNLQGDYYSSYPENWRVGDLSETSGDYANTFSKMKKGDLQEELRKRDLDTTGVKAVLYERLLDAVLEEEVEEDDGGNRKQAHLAVTAGKYRHQGVPVGYNTLAAEGGGAVTHSAYSKDQVRLKVATVSQRPCTKAQYVFQLGLDVYQRAGAGPCNPTSNNIRTFATLGKPSTNDSEWFGCASIANRLAAFFGLYYYEGCMNKGVNWTQELTIKYKGNSYPFNVRMRLPNPAYDYYEGELWCKEPLQDNDLGKINNQLSLVAGGFPVPTLENPKSPVLFEDNYGMWFSKKDSEEQVFATRIAPFFGDEKEQKKLRELCAACAEVFGGLVDEPEEAPGMMAGFLAPSAIWLWPHGPDADVDLGDTRPSNYATDGIPLSQRYQQRPKWLNGSIPTYQQWQESAEKLGELRKWVGAGFASLLQPFVVKDSIIRRAYVLGMETNPKRVKMPEELASWYDGGGAPAPQQQQVFLSASVASTSADAPPILPVVRFDPHRLEFHSLAGRPVALEDFCLDNVHCEKIVHVWEEDYSDRYAEQVALEADLIWGSSVILI